MNWIEKFLRYWFIVMRGKFSFLFIFPTRTFREFVFHSISNSTRQFQFKFNRIEIFQTNSRREKVLIEFLEGNNRVLCTHCLKIFWSLLYSLFLTVIVSIDSHFEILSLKLRVHSTRKLKLYWIICRNNLIGHRFKADLITVSPFPHSRTLWEIFISEISLVYLY